MAVQRSIEERNRLALENQGLIGWVMKHASSKPWFKWIPHTDVRQEAWLGLLRGCANFDPEKGNLSTIVTKCIWDQLKWAAYHHWMIISVPVIQAAIPPRFKKHSDDIISIASSNFHISDKKWRLVPAKEHSPYEGPSWSEIVKSCSERGRDILYRRYCLHMTSEAIAKEWGVTKQRISQLEKKAMTSIRGRGPKLGQEWLCGKKKILRNDQPGCRSRARRKKP